MNEEKISNIFRITPTKIEGFFKQYRFLSNFHVAEVVYEGIKYPSTEHAYQAAKTLDIEERKRIAALSTCMKARNEGQKLQIRKDWEQVKVQVMEEVVRDKFTRHEDLKDLLLQTDDKELEETNWWKDSFWGVYKGTGESHLGKILMKIRDEIKRNKY